MTCVRCGDQPEGSILGEQVCSVHCANAVVGIDLRELIEEWRAFKEDIDPIDDMQAQQHTTLTECINDLEQVLDE